MNIEEALKRHRAQLEISEMVIINNASNNGIEDVLVNLKVSHKEPETFTQVLNKKLNNN